MAFVGVEDLGIDTHRLQGPHPADAEQDLLADPVLRSAAVEAVGDGAKLVVVVLHVGIEEVQLHPPDLRQPQLGFQRRARNVDGDPDAIDQVQGHAVRVEHRVALLLPPFGVEVLAEVPQAVHQAHPGQGYAEAAGRLQVVAGQHA